MNRPPHDFDPAPSVPEEDAKLTAFVLGELEEPQRRALADRAERDPALAAEIEAIRGTANDLAADLAAEAAPGLTERQRRAVLGEPRRGAVLVSLLHAPRLWAGVGLAAAACMALALLWPLVRHGPARPETMAMNESRRYARPSMGAPAPTPAPTPAADARPPAKTGNRTIAPPAPGSALGPILAERAAGTNRARADVPSAGRLFAGQGLAGGTVVRDGLGRAARLETADLDLPFPGAMPSEAADLGGGGEPGAAVASGEAYAALVDSAFRSTADHPLSTLSTDVDTASYSNVRRFLSAGALPPPDAVRIEEMINAFDYAYEQPSGDRPFSIAVDGAACPWHEGHRLVRIGLRGRAVPPGLRPATSLVFLIDVSGSMNAPKKLPLVKQSLRLLIDHLTADDRIAVVVYAGSSGLALPSTYCDEKEKILAAIDALEAGGSTNGGEGIQLAYRTARESFIKGGVNRVILCTDGDFNVGLSREDQLLRLITEERSGEVFLSVLGFGTGNWQDDRMEKLSNAGNGNFAYIDGLAEARRVLVEKMAGTLVTIARDVKVQVEFNPARVGAYRLIGYANRRLAATDFDDDRRDAGEIGAGHTVTVLYEIVPAAAPETRAGGALLTVKLRAKPPEGGESRLFVQPLTDLAAEPGPGPASADLRFAAAVASFGMILRDSPYRGTSSYEGVLELAGPAAEVAPAAEAARRAEFLDLVRRARDLAGR